MAAGEGLVKGPDSDFRFEEGGWPGVGVPVVPLLSDDGGSDDLPSPLPEGGEVEFEEPEEARSVEVLEESVFEPTGEGAGSVGVGPSGVAFGVSVGRGVFGTTPDESPTFVDVPFGTVGVGVGVGATGPGVGVGVGATGPGVGVGETGPVVGVGVGETGPGVGVGVGVGEGVTVVGVGEGVTVVGVGEGATGVGVGVTVVGVGVGVAVVGVGVGVTRVGVVVGVGVTRVVVGVGEGATGPTGWVGVGEDGIGVGVGVGDGVGCPSISPVRIEGVGVGPAGTGVGVTTVGVVGEGEVVAERSTTTKMLTSWAIPRVVERSTLGVRPLRTHRSSSGSKSIRGDGRRPMRRRCDFAMAGRPPVD